MQMAFGCIGQEPAGCLVVEVQEVRESKKWSLQGWSITTGSYAG